MKSVSNEILSLQKNSFVKIIDKIYLYHQYSGMVKSIASTILFKIHGDATSLFLEDDWILLPFKDFETERQIDIAPVYDAGDDDTEIQLVSNDATFGLTSDLGTPLLKKINITEKLVTNSISSVKNSVESSNLTDFDSGYIDVIVDNSDKYFINSDSTGIFNNNDIFWCKYIMTYKGYSDSFLFFGGIINKQDFIPDLYNKTLTIRAYGHSKELERYPAFNVINTDNNNFTRIPGMEIISFTEGEYSEPGIKSIYYNPFSNSKFQGVKVDSVSVDTLPGIKKLEFKYPFWFRWDNGAWTKFATIGDTTDGIKKIYAYGGSGN